MLLYDVRISRENIKKKHDDCYKYRNRRVMCQTKFEFSIDADKDKRTDVRKERNTLLYPFQTY